jgi:DNA-binding beta-propeller fold protein YncE
MRFPLAVLALRLAMVLVGAWMAGSARAQSIYTPYAFTNFVGQPGLDGWMDGAGNGGQFHIPQGVAVDAAGNLFVADTFNHAIRKVTPAGMMTTIAGSPSNKGYGDGVGLPRRRSFSARLVLVRTRQGTCMWGITGIRRSER